MSQQYAECKKGGGGYISSEREKEREKERRELKAPGATGTGAWGEQKGGKLSKKEARTAPLPPRPPPPPPPPSTALALSDMVMLIVDTGERGVTAPACLGTSRRLSRR